MNTCCYKCGLNQYFSRGLWSGRPGKAKSKLTQLNLNVNRQLELSLAIHVKINLPSTMMLLVQCFDLSVSPIIYSLPRQPISNIACDKNSKQKINIIATYVIISHIKQFRSCIQMSLHGVVSRTM